MAGVVMIRWPIVLFFERGRAESFHSALDLETSGEPIVLDGYLAACDSDLRTVALIRDDQGVRAELTDPGRFEGRYTALIVEALRRLERRGQQEPGLDSMDATELFRALIRRLG